MRHTSPAPSWRDPARSRQARIPGHVTTRGRFASGVLAGASDGCERWGRPGGFGGGLWPTDQRCAFARPEVCSQRPLQFTQCSVCGSTFRRS